MVECAKRILGLYHEAQGNNVDNIVPYQSKFQVLLVANFKDVIPRNLYPRIKVILISRIRRLCNFIGKYILCER
jgi:hypothetical protein